MLAGVHPGHDAAQATLIDAIAAVDALGHRREQLERQIVARVPGSPWARDVRATALLARHRHADRRWICAEIGDFERSERTEQPMNSVGLVPSENSTGEQRRLGAITKTGSGHARRPLVEAAWHDRKRPAINKALAGRQDGQPAHALRTSSNCSSPGASDVPGP